MGNRIFWTVFWMAFTLVYAYGQQEDSLQLGFSQLNWKDVKSGKKLLTATKVISGSRSEKEVADLPFSIFVITGEEIRQNGYLTLTDVLKRLPGIRVSQPGSALEGETFLMRGLIGNSYAKILINDVPIKPFLVSGMPIGAQLPIREAERIEIIYGPAATLYGADASAGIINIILKDSERPVYVQADLGFGTNGFENLDIMFSGKMGKGKRVLKFKVFGNYTFYNDRKIIYDIDTLYNPRIYEDIIEASSYSYLDRPNYKGTEESPQFGQLPHLSSALGIDLQYQNWQFSIQRYYRRDHSSIGLNPYAVSYANPLNYFGEHINNFNLSFSKTKNRFNIKTSLSTLLYETDERSSYSYVIPVLNLVHQEFADLLVGSDTELDSLRMAIDDFYFSGTRFSSASSIEGIADVLMGYKFNKSFELAGGINLQAGAGSPLLNFSPNPLGDIGNSTEVKRIVVDDAIYFDLSSFLEAYLNIGKWNIIVGTQLFTRRSDYLKTNRIYFNPRLALQYRWTDKFSIRASTGRSFRYPSPYYSATSYTISLDNYGFARTGANLSPEKTYSAELGCRWKLGAKVHGDASVYYTRTIDFIRYSIQPNFDFTEFTLGYSNDNKSFAELYGIQSSISFTNIIQSIGLNSTININYARGKEARNFYSFAQGDNISFTLGGLLSQPEWIAQVDFEFRPFKKVRLLFENTYMTNSWTRNTLLYQVPDLVNNEQLLNPGFYTLDVTVNYQFNKNLLAYLKVNNIFDTEYAGIDATSDANGLFYNPQTKRFIRIGINYRLE